MRKLHLLLLVISYGSFGQLPVAFDIERKADMPMRTANNAVVGAVVNGNSYAYSFCGIDTSLTNSGIHLKSFKYDVANDQWALLPDVPDTLGKIAASASLVGDIIYVIGGYYVFNGSPFELSSNKVHRFDTQTDSWLSDGANIPIEIDDQVQVVWNDSLIYVVTGWSNTANVPAVQIYDPANDNWLSGTPVPNTVAYNAFGASGTIVGDTIYYYGGASSSGFNFPALNRLRKGAIDPNDPTQITWSETNQTPGTLYRPGAFNVWGAAHWIGGSATSYNFDALAYNGSGVVSPTMEVRTFDPLFGWAVTDLSHNVDSGSVMDIRGVAGVADQVGGTASTFFVLGGIGHDQQVLNSTYMLRPLVVGVDENSAENEKIQIYPNPGVGTVNVQVDELDKYSDYQVFNAVGRLVEEGLVNGSELILDTQDYPSGGYLLKLIGTDRVVEGRFWSVK